MAITKENILHVAKLARLDIAEGDIEKLTEQMGNIVKFVEKINELDTSKVEPMAAIMDDANFFREDTQTPSLPVSVTESLAPRFESGHIVVPAVIE
jgi:aspartyl-tRNA(Asn)/glutamyl-tRNA(Gln) amidotransferase subunit C